jgi:hypothetical protein
VTPAEKARAFIAEHDLAEHVAGIVNQAPPLPEQVAQVWRDAAHRSRFESGDAG